MSGAAQYMMTGRFSPEMWQEIRKEPGHPLAEIVKTGEGRAVTVEHFFYALDDNDFYTVLNAADAVSPSGFDGSVSGVFEVVAAFGRFDRGYEVADVPPCILDGSLLGMAHPVLDLGEGLLDRVEIG